jgi:hypothetical protein
VHEPPPITITDPGKPREPADVLVAGSERPPLRVPRRLLVIGTAAVLVVVGSVVGLDRWDAHQVAARRAAAAFAIADTVHVHLSVAEGGVYAEAPLEITEPDLVTGADRVVPQPLPSTGTLTVPLVVADDAASLTEIRDVRAVGKGVATTFDPSLSLGRIPGGSSPLAVPVTFPCSAVSAGRYPVLTGVVVVVVPESGRQHRVTLPVTSTRALALEACLLPDPAAVPETSVEEQHGRLLLSVTSVPHTRQALQIVAVTSPGFALAVVGGVPGRPAGEVQPDSGVLFDVRVRVTDCTAARAGHGVVTVSLRQGARHWTLVVPDSPANAFRRPGSSWLQLTVKSACH